MLFYQSILLLCSWVSEGCLNQQTPLDLDSRSVYHPSTAFEEKVSWALEQFKVPGLAISFINGSRVFTKVSNVPFTFLLLISTLFRSIKVEILAA